MDNIVFWHWSVAAVVLIIFEVLLPGTFFLWMGVSASVVGVLLWIDPAMGWEWQMFLFAIISVVSITLWRIWSKKHPPLSDEEPLNQRTQHYVGRTFTLKEPIVDGVGKIYVDDAQWRINGADCDAGTQVNVVSADGLILYVEPV